MSTREAFILEISVLIFIGVLMLIGLTLLILRRLHARPLPNSPVTRADVELLGQSVENMRAQNSAEHSAIQAEQRSQGNVLRRLMNRFGFLREGGD